MNRSQSVKRQTKARKRRIENARKKNDAKQKRVQARIRYKAETSDAETVATPMFRARSIQYEVSDRIQVIGYGGIGLIHSLAQQSGLIEAIDRNVQLLTFHVPYHESDHVLNIAYNAMTGGQYLEDLELKRKDEAYLDALGTTRMIVIRKNLSEERGERVLLEKILYFFYITNDRTSTADEVVFSCNDRCNQENIIEQLKNGPRAFRAPVDNLYSNWAYMVMASVAWSLKAWSALWLPEAGRWKDRRHSEKFKLLKMEFRTFVNTIIRIPCQILTTGRRTVYRLLAWNDSQPIFWRMVAVLNL